MSIQMLWRRRDLEIEAESEKVVFSVWTVSTVRREALNQILAAAHVCQSIGRIRRPWMSCPTHKAIMSLLWPAKAKMKMPSVLVIHLRMPLPALSLQVNRYVSKYPVARSKHFNS